MVNLEIKISSSSPLAGLTVGMCKRNLFVPVGGCSLEGSQCVFILLAGRLDEGDKSDEAEEEKEFVLISEDRVHTVQGQRLAETLIAHVEGPNEAEVLHAI